MTYAWISDIHLDCVPEDAYVSWVQKVLQTNPKAIFLTGDIAEADSVIPSLHRLHHDFKMPIYFVLGNHDFYGGTIAEVRKEVGELPYFYLSQRGVIALNENIALIGQDGWTDGRAGDYAHSQMLLRDYFEINDFIGLSKEQRLTLMQKLADSDNKKIEADLKMALDRYKEVILLTHVPPFHEASLYHNKIATAEAAPHFVNQSLGKILLKIMLEHPEKSLLVLCGHTHHGAEYQPLSNLRVFVAWADYGQPILQNYSLPFS